MTQLGTPQPMETKCMFLLFLVFLVIYYACKRQAGGAIYENR